jgi:hypothetical protein
MSNPPVIDYTDKDFASLRDAMLRLASQRLPEWTDQSPADLGILLVDLFAYCGDIMAYYQDRIASELFPATATERASVVDLVRLIGYELQPATPATADLLLIFDAPKQDTDPRTVTVPSGTTFTAKTGGTTTIEFTYLGPDLSLALDSDQLHRGTDTGDTALYYDRLPVEQSSVPPGGPAVLGSAADEPNQAFPLPQPGVVLDSVVVQVLEGADWVTWERRDSLLFNVAEDGRVVFSYPYDRIYQLLVDATDVPQVVFGSGRRPPVGTNNIRATYRVCQGAGGNLAAGTITGRPAIDMLRAVTNPEPAAGGSDAEESDHAVRYAPLMFRSTNRAVTVSDYVALAQRTGTVAKVRANSTAWNRIDLYIAPAADELRPVPESLRNRLVGYFEDKRMASTLVQVLDAQPAPVDISVELLIDERFPAVGVSGKVQQAIAGLLAFDTVDFGQTVYQSDVYSAAESVPGVLAATVTRFRRPDLPQLDLDAELAAHGLPPLAQLPAFLQSAVSMDIDRDGRIEVGQFEIPVLGELNIAIRSGPP